MFCHARPSSLNFTGILFLYKNVLLLCFFGPGWISWFFCQFKRLTTLKNTQKWNYTNVKQSPCCHNLHQSGLRFHILSHDWNVLSSRKISLCLLNRSFLYCFTSEIVLLWPEFYLLPPRPTSPLVAAILFLPEQSWTHFQVLCFGSHMRSSWDLPFNKCPPNDLSRLANFNSHCT